MGEELARKLVIENTNALAEIFEPVEVVKGDLYTPFIDKAEETVAELTYKKAFLRFMEIRCQILLICGLKKN